MNSTYDTDKIIVIEFVERARKVLPGTIQHAYWFGSRSQGMGHDDSDYDVLLETVGQLSEKHRDILADIAIDLTAEHGSLLDVHAYPVDQLRHGKISRSPLVQLVHRDGVLL